MNPENTVYIRAISLISRAEKRIIFHHNLLKKTYINTIILVWFFGANRAKIG